MCGLAGIAAFGGGDAPAYTPALLRSMTRTIAHRGPDDAELLAEGPVGFGFVRLSLVSPEDGSQPLRTDDGDLVLVANGEVYNHRELAAELGVEMRTGSDCEVLLHLYRRHGLDFLDRVRGMFALVLWDRRAQRLVIARDRFGIKPVYFHADRDRIVFGSEIKALLHDPACPRELDWGRALADQLMTGNPVFDDSPAHAWFTGIELAEAATITTFDLRDGSRRDHRYWTFPSYDGAGTGGEDDLIQSYAATLAEAVRDCETADVEVGLFLSGGVDSAAIAALSSNRPQTFTSLNGGTLVNTDAEFAHRIAGHLGLVNHQVAFPGGRRPGVEEWKQLVWQLETPLLGPEAFYKYELYRHVVATAPSVKAMMLGGGADEFNGGYTTTFAGGGDWTDFVANIDRMGVRTSQQRRPALGAWWEQSGPPLVRADVLREAAGDPADPYDALFRWKYRDVQLYNCWHEDRTAAGNGIEARVPFLDHRLVEIMAAVPEQLRPALVWDKQILRRGLAGVLPPEFASRPKIPFFYGDGVAHTYRTFIAMLAQDGDRLLEEATSGPRAKEFLDADNLRAQLRQLEADPLSGHVEFLLRVVNLGLLDTLVAAPPAPLVDSPKPPVALAVPVTDWDAQAVALDDLVLGRTPLARDAVVALADEVLLLTSPDDPDTWYVVVDGSIEFVVDGSEDPDWLAFLRALDGERSVAAIVAGLGIEPDALEPLLTEAVDARLLTVEAAR